MRSLKYGLVVLMLLGGARSVAAEPGDAVVHSISEGGLSGIEATFTVHAAAADTFRVLADTGRLSEYMPALRESRILEHGSDYDVVQFEGDTGQLVERRVYEPPLRIHWTLIRGTALKDLKGEWRLEPAGSDTTVHYTVLIRPSLPIPPAVISYFQDRNLPALVRNVRARIESGGRWTK